MNYSAKNNRPHALYPPTDQVGVLAAAFDPAVRRAWVESGHPQLTAYEEQAAARGMQIWPKHDGHVYPNENLVTFIQNNNVLNHWRGGHEWEEPNGYAVVDAHHQAAAYHQQAAAYHQKAAAHHERGGAF